MILPPTVGWTAAIFGDDIECSRVVLLLGMVVLEWCCLK